MMLVNEWIETIWSVLNVRDKTLKDYKTLKLLPYIPSDI